MRRAFWEGGRGEICEEQRSDYATGGELGWCISRFSSREKHGEEGGKEGTLGGAKVGKGELRGGEGFEA